MTTEHQGLERYAHRGLGRHAMHSNPEGEWVRADAAEATIQSLQGRVEAQRGALEHIVNFLSVSSADWQARSERTVEIARAALSEETER